MYWVSQTMKANNVNDGKNARTEYKNCPYDPKNPTVEIELFASLVLNTGFLGK